MAGKGCHRSAARRGLLGSRARAPRLSAALSARLYVPLRQTQLEASRPKSRTGTHLIPDSWASEDQIRGPSNVYLKREFERPVSEESWLWQPNRNDGGAPTVWCSLPESKRRAVFRGSSE